MCARVSSKLHVSFETLLSPPSRCCLLRLAFMGRCPTASPAARAESVFASRSGRSSEHRFRSEEHTSELQSRLHLVCRLLLEKKKHTHPALHLRQRATST